jgi:pilus assembly protein CpaF
MNPYTDAQVALRGRVTGRMVARLYLDLVPTSGETRDHMETELEHPDGMFGRVRPAAPEMRRTLEELLASGQVPDDNVLGMMVTELVIFGRIEFGEDWKTTRSKWRELYEAQFDAALAEEDVALSPEERQALLHAILTDLLDFGPLEELLADPDITEVLVDGPGHIYVERQGQLEDVPNRFRNDDHLMLKVHRICAPLGKRLDAAHPILDARLPDGSRVNVVLPPVSLIGPALTIRKHSKTPITWEQLLEWGSVSEDILEFLRACVRARANIVIAGGTGSGKTTMLNRVTELIPGDERVVVIEHVAEIQPSSHIDHIVRLETRPPNWEGKGEITMRDLVINALRMRPDRIICGEVYGGEVLELVQAMNTGHDGTLIHMHASDPYDALARLETMITMASTPLPLRAIREQIAAAIHLLVFQERLRDGTRKIVKVSEVVGMVDDVYALQDIYEFRETGIQKGRATGYHTATGNIPRLLSRIRDRGIELPMSMFTPR